MAREGFTPPGDVEAFLRSTSPFDVLDDAARAAAVAASEVRYARRGTRLMRPGDRPGELYVLRRGAVELLDDGDLVARLGEGACLGHGTLLRDTPARLEARTVEDTLYYALAGEAFRALVTNHPDFGAWFRDDLRRRLARAVRPRQEAAVGTRRAGDLLRRPAVTASGEVSIADAARQMTAERVSALVVSGEDGSLGVVTDRDLRSRVLARGLPGNTAVGTVVSRPAVTAEASAPLAELLDLMLRHRIHHLPILDAGSVRGVLHREDLLRAEAEHPLFLLAEIERQPDRAGVVRTADRLPELVVRLADADVPAEHAGRVIASVTDALTRRLIELAEHVLGPAPAPWAWIALGSQGRREQLAGSDQDNALILADDAPAGGAAWFAEMAGFVCDGLAECGIPRCRGEVMAVNPQWRLTAAAWRERFRGWIDEPEQQALMYASIFFDMRHVAGDPALTDEVTQAVRAMARPARIFLHLMTANALTRTPPLGFFRRFVLERDGREERALDLKHRGTALIVDLARIHALAHGVPAVHTADRLRELAGIRLNEADARSLVDALELIDHLRLRHQAALLRTGHALGHGVTNHLPPAELSTLEQRHLRAAFELVRTAQQVLAHEYHLA